MSNNNKSNKGMFSQENIQATLLPEPRFSARLEAKGKSRKPTSENIEDVDSVDIATHSSRGDKTSGELQSLSQRERHGDPNSGPQADNEHETPELVETVRAAPVEIEDEDIDENAVRQKERELEEIIEAQAELDRKDAARQRRLRIEELNRIIQEKRRKLEAHREKMQTTATEVGQKVSIRVQDSESTCSPVKRQEQTVRAPVDLGGDDMSDRAYRMKERQLEEIRKASREADRQDAERLRRQKFAYLEKQIQEEQDQLLKKREQLNISYATFSQTASPLNHQDSALYPTGSNAPSSENRPTMEQSIGNVKSTVPNVGSPSYSQPFHQEETRYSSNVERGGVTPQLAPRRQPSSLCKNLPSLDQLRNLKREGDFIALKIERFEEYCDMDGIHSDEQRYQLLDKLMTFEAVTNYRNKYPLERRNYQTMKKFLIGAENRLSCVLQHREERDTISSSELDADVGTWMAQLKDEEVLRKFVTIHLAPNQLKGKIREKLRLSTPEFDKAVRGLCDTIDHERKVKERNVSYTNRQPARNPPGRGQQSRQTNNGYSNHRSEMSQTS